jgi:hypothetical protein
VEVLSLTGYRPSPRFDDVAWTEARIEQALLEDGPWTALDTITLDPVDADPTDPAERNFTVEYEVADGEWFRVVFLDDDANEQPTEPVSTAGPVTVYTTLASAREALGVETSVLSDDALAVLVSTAEDLIDDMLGARVIDIETGRKVDPHSIADWQLVKLSDATNLLAKFLYRNPNWELEQRASSAGSDVPVSGPYGSPFPRVTALLDASRLRRLTTVANSGVGRRSEPWIGNLPEPD